MKKVTFINSRGQSIELSNSRPFLLSKVDGLGDVNADIQLQKAPYQDGATYLNSLLGERSLTFEIAIIGDNPSDVQGKRTQLASVFNPKLGEGLLRYGNEGEIKEIKAVADNVPFFPSGRNNRGKTYQRSVVNLICPNPFWTTEEQVDQLVVWDGGLEFPLQLPTQFARQSLSKAKILFNEGDVETPIVIVFNGPATAPITIKNLTTNEYIEVNQSLLPSEKLEINTAFGQKRVTKVLADGTRQNAFHFISLDSTFFNLEQGNNLIDYSTGEDYERAAVSITWCNRYLAV